MPGHAVDVPVTNLDETDDDDIMTETDEELDPTVLQDDFELNDEDSYNHRQTLGAKIKDIVGRFTAKGYTRVPKPIATNGIELAYRDADDSFDLSDDEFILKRQSATLYHGTIALIKKYTVASLILGLIVTVIVLSVLLSKRGSHPREEVSQKVLLSNGTALFYPTTMLISLDGFHPHYISSELTPTLHNLLTKGYGAPYMIPSFPSSTFPNHWTIATGLYPQDHGIVGNTFYDPALNRRFINVIPDMSLDPVFWGGEPIWATAEQNGVRSAIHMFPGSEVPFLKWNPSEVDKYNGTETLEAKVERITGWLDRDLETRPELILAYVPTIDSLGHKYGIHGKEIEQGLRGVDSFIKNITESISNRNLSDIINFVVVSDHGMSPTSNDRLIYLDDLMNVTQIQYTDGWPLYGLRPYPQYSVKSIFAELKASFKENSGYSIYLREDLPSELHFGGPKDKVYNKEYYNRTAPIWIIPDIGYSITTHDDMERKGNDYTPKGTHGYNNTEVLMRAIFLGDGPFFKSKIGDEGSKIKPFNNIEVYNFLCETLNIKPAPNNGSSDIFSKDKVLPEDWKDPQSYPGVDFSIGDLLKAESSYDLLFRPKQDRVTTTLGPAKVESSSSETIISTVEPSATVPNEQDDTDDLSDVDSDAQSTGDVSGDESDVEDSTVGSSAGDVDDDYNGSLDEGSSDKDDESEDSDDEEPDAKETHDEKHKGFFESLEDDLEELADDIIDEAKDIADEIHDAAEAAYDRVMDHGKNDD